MTNQLKNAHEPFSIVLELDDKEKRFVTPKKINGSLFREAVSISQEIENEDDLLIDLDSHFQFVCDVFGNQFGITEFEEGSDARDLMKIVYATTIFVMGQVTLASEMLTHNTDVSNLDKKKA